MPIETYQLWMNKELVVPALSLRNSMEANKSITWDEDKTSILDATLDIKVDPGMLHVRAWVEHNLDEIPLWWWEWEHNVRTGTFSIMTALNNGPNKFKFVGAKDLIMLAFRTKFIVTASVIIEYSGEEPDIGPDWKKYLGYAAVGVGTVGAVIAVGGGLKEKEGRVP